MKYCDGFVLCKHGQSKNSSGHKSVAEVQYGSMLILPVQARTFDLLFFRPDGLATIQQDLMQYSIKLTNQRKVQG